MSKFIPRKKNGKEAQQDLNRKKAWKEFSNFSSKSFIFAVMISMSLFLTGCSSIFSSENDTQAFPLKEASATVSHGRAIPHRYAIQPALTTPVGLKDYTVMLYMNGSDLESKYGAATDDLIEMAESNFNGENINLVIFTGGTNEWHLDFIPGGSNAIFVMEDGYMTQLADLGTDSMASPEVLAGFINFCKDYFPAENYGLVLWNHGGGAIVGYGSDERYEDSPDLAMMKLSDLDRALEASAPEKGFQFIGFDTCLMATLEMAGIAAKYGDYFIASEELEPGPGWDYRFLGEIKPGDTGKEIGIEIIDYFRDFYENSGMDDIATLSMTELSKITPAYEAFEKLALEAGSALADGKYNLISKARASSRAFGGGQDGETDMIDLAQLATSLSDMFPDESKALYDAVNKAVIYKYDNYPGEIGGLSVYFPFENKENIDYYVDVYRSMGQLPNYSRFIGDFSVMLTEPLTGFNGFNRSGINRPWLESADDGEIIISDEQIDNISEIRLSAWMEPKSLGFDGIGDYVIKLFENEDVVLEENNRVKTSLGNSPVSLNGHTICSYEIARNGERIRYKIPAQLNGEDAHLIAAYCDEYPDGRIIGAVPLSDNIFNMLDKKIIPVKDGDEITLRYYARPSSSFNLEDYQSKWLVGDSFIVEGSLKLSRENPYSHDLRYMLNLVDTKKNDNYLPINISS